MTQEEKDARKELLRQNSALALPDNPSSSHWSSVQIKSLIAKGEFMLLNWINELDDNIGNTIVGFAYSVETQKFIVTFKDGSNDEIEISQGTGNANIYYDDTLPQDTSKLKSGDLYFDE